MGTFAAWTEYKGYSPEAEKAWSFVLDSEFNFDPPGVVFIRFTLRNLNYRSFIHYNLPIFRTLRDPPELSVN